MLARPGPLTESNGFVWLIHRASTRTTATLSCSGIQRICLRRRPISSTLDRRAPTNHGRSQTLSLGQAVRQAGRLGETAGGRDFANAQVCRPEQSLGAIEPSLCNVIKWRSTHRTSKQIVECAASQTGHISQFRNTDPALDVLFDKIEHLGQTWIDPLPSPRTRHRFRGSGLPSKLFEPGFSTTPRQVQGPRGIRGARAAMTGADCAGPVVVLKISPIPRRAIEWRRPCGFQTVEVEPSGAEKPIHQSSDIPGTDGHLPQAGYGREGDPFPRNGEHRARMGKVLASENVDVMAPQRLIVIETLGAPESLEKDAPVHGVLTESQGDGAIVKDVVPATLGAITRDGKQAEGCRDRTAESAPHQRYVRERARSQRPGSSETRRLKTGAQGDRIQPGVDQPFAARLKENPSALSQRLEQIQRWRVVARNAPIWP